MFHALVKQSCQVFVATVFLVAVFAMSLVDSIAAFTVRCDEIDDSRQMALLLNRQGINTFSSMAFSIGTPNQPPTDAAFEQFAQRVFTLHSMGHWKIEATAF